MTNIYCLLFPDYETLDLMGPVEFLYRIPDSRLHYVSYTGSMISSRQGFAVATEKLTDLLPDSLLLVVGGQGTRPLVQDSGFLQQLAHWVAQSRYCLSVCTGSALLAAAGCLDGIRATSNKKALEWVKSTGQNVSWQNQARWVADGKFYTSSGVSAGMDMVLGFIADCYGKQLAQEMAIHAEYNWNDKPEQDDFAKLYGY